MQYTVPHYYKSFACTASECSDTCCAGWQIMIDEKTLEKYKKAKGPFGNRLRNSVNFKESSFYQYDGRCAFLNEENLCDIYTEAGPKMLCRTCRLYPRHIEEFEGLKEISLSLSCPEAAKLILGSTEKVHFITKEKETREESVEDFDFLVFTKLMDARDIMFRILQNRSFPLRTRMGIVLGYAHDLQSRMDAEQIFAMDEVNERYGREDAPERLQKKLAEYGIEKAGRFSLMQGMMKDLGTLEVLRKSWPSILKKRIEILYGNGKEAYKERRKEFLESGCCDWDITGEQLMIYFLFTYMAGAVYDDNVYAKVKLSVVSTLLIMEMIQSVYQEKGTFMTEEDILKTAGEYSREIEHSDLNLNALEELYMLNGRYDLEHLLECIMS